ncbi:DUF4174 domain-containing protein [Algoriphagus sp. D3-2-R+10]|uniref:DUF4174 domain-containing protein n=1 Tax=Algoriphagus aurantiacus TaxID=3103948 RepID=UPI002B3877FD|nr:DUF4174 domain-containing protein [Algoriphagus sp. D3-2-R+10]MEB2775166.1 DUF4174 domain-containing protein [Algoriphagus sp. D3-2-R+10]
MKSYFLLLYLFFMVPQNGKTIEDYRWINRIVIMNFENLTLDSLLVGMEKSSEERKLLFVEFKNGKFIKSSGEDEIDSGGFIKVLSRTTPNPEWVLIGLDGGVKASGAYHDFSLKKIFELIDHMPMRQSKNKKVSSKGVNFSLLYEKYPV